MNIGLIDVDKTGFPNLALMKLSSYHKSIGDTVEWYNPFDSYDMVYMSKVFTFTKDYNEYILNSRQVEIGGTGYDIHKKLPKWVEYSTPDYSIYPNISKDTAYGYLTRGCVNKCPWCIVPEKEGGITPYMDIEDVAAGRKMVVLMDNNILAAGDYAIEQLEKIIEKGYRIDFNQAMDARLVTEEIADLLAKIKWIKYIRFGCDTKKQITDCEKAIRIIQQKGYKGEFMLYTMLHGKAMECYNRITFWKYDFPKVIVTAQPYRDFNKANRIPQWQKAMARWANRRWIYRSCDFMEYEHRQGITGLQLLKES